MLTAYYFFYLFGYLEVRSEQNQMPANSASVKRHVDPVIFKEFLRRNNISIRQLGALVDTNEKTIRRMLQQEEVTLNVAVDLCTFFHCTFDDIFGKDDSVYWHQKRLQLLKMLR
jgi:DNA-binding XRE family transcriptional regulator